MNPGSPFAPTLGITDLFWLAVGFCALLWLLHTLEDYWTYRASLRHHREQDAKK